jgi:hypothetical protein
VQKHLNIAGLYTPGAWQVIVGAVLLSPFVAGVLIPASVLWTSRRITRQVPQVAPPGSPATYLEPQVLLPGITNVAQATAAEHRLARWTTALLYIGLAADGLGIVSGFLQRALLLRIASGERLLPGVAEANDARHQTIAGLQLLAFIVTAIVWLVWLSRAYSNLGAVGTRKSRFTPGWAVGYWFVPFVNFVRPYQITLDLWQRSERLNVDDSVTNLPRPAIISWWWGVYLLTAFAGRMFASLARDTKSLPELISVTLLGMVVDAIGIVAALLAVAVVRGIDERQQRFTDPSAVLLATASPPTLDAARRPTTTERSS